MASVAFRLTIYQANGTTPDLTVTSVRGGTNPYIVDVPSGDGQEVDLLTGAVRSGAYNVRVADVVTGSTATGTVRLVTTKLEDADYRQHLLSRRATLECSRNGGSTWAIWTSGYLTALRQTDAMTYEFTVSDSRRLESTHTAFTWWSDTNKTTDERREFPNRGCLMGGPLIENFGPIRASGGWEFRWREVQSGYLALAFTAAYDPPAYQRSQYFNPAKFRADARTFLRRLPPVASLTGANFEQLRDREFVWGYPELLAAVTDGTTTWYGSVRAAFTPVNYSGSGAGDRNLGPDVERSNFIFVELDPNQSTSYPSSNAKVRVRILQREVSEISPIYIDEHPVDIAVKLYKTVGIPYNSSSVTSTKAAVGDDVRLALRIGEPVNMGEFLSNAIFGPFGFSARTNSSGEQEFFPTRIANATAPTTTIAVNDIVGDAPPPVFEVDEGTVVTSFRLTAQALTQFVPDPDNKVEPPSDGLVAIENTQVVQNADTTTFSTREVAYEIPGMVHDGSASGAAFVLSPEVVGRFFTGIVAEGFDRFGRGAIVSEVQVLASSTAASLQVGDEVVLNIPYYPNKNYRIGESTVGTRIAQIVRRTEMPEGPIFKLVDSGVNQQPTSPTFTIASWTGDPRRVAQVTVTNAGTLNTAQVTLAVQYQVSANMPTKTGTLFTRFRPGTIPTGAFLLPTVPPGSKVWVRMRTEKTELRASAWTSWTSVTLTSWTAPTSLAAGATTANSVSLSWSLAGNTLDPMDVFAYPGASAPADWTPYRITTLSAGSTTTIVRDLNPSTQYTFGVAFKDIGTGAYSGFTTVTASTNAVNTSTCPAAPKMKVITSFDTAGSTTGVVLSLGAIEGYNVVVQRAPNVAGSPGTWADIAVLAPLTGYYADILPSDGVTRWYRVFYRLSGFLDGAPGTARSAVPVAIPDDLILTEGPSIISGGSSLSFGNYLTGTPDSFYDGSTAQSVAVDATSANTANKVVARDNTGSFSANVVTATLDGPAPAGQLTGSTLAANVLTSSLTSVGTIGTGVWEGTSVGKNYGGTGLTSTAFAGITNERVMAYDGVSGSFFLTSAGSNGQALVYNSGALAWGNPAPGPHVLATTTGLGAEHTVSGLTAGMILQATSATAARFQTPSIPASSITAGSFGGLSYTFTNDLTVSGTLTASLPYSSITSKPSYFPADLTAVNGTLSKDNGGTSNASWPAANSGEYVVIYDSVTGAERLEAGPQGTTGQALITNGGALTWGNPAPAAHVLATTTALGPDHTVSGLTTGMILQATGATTARFQTPSIPASSVTAGTFSGTSYTITNDLTVSGTLTASLPWSSITSTPTTLSGYGITDALSNSTSSTQSGYFGDIYLWDDATPSHYLQITNSANLTAARTLSINVNDASRTISLSGNLTVSGNADISGTSSGTNTGDQTITLTGAITGSGTGSFATTYAGTVPIAKGGTNQTAYSTTGTGTRVVVYDQGFGRFDVQPAGTAGQFLKSSGTAGDVIWDTPPNFSSTTPGYAPASGGGTSNFLRADGSWAVPSVGSVSANNVTAGTFAGASYTFSNSVTFTSGVRVANGETYKILNSGGTAVDVLSATTLGTGVINSSLTSVGTLTSGAIGTGFTAIANSALANSSITINGTSVSLGGSITLPLTQWTTSGSNIYFNTGNVSIGTTPSSSIELLVRGGGTTASTYGFLVENSAATSTFWVNDAGNVQVPNGSLTVGVGLSVDGTTFNVDAANNRAGIGISSPISTLDIRGSHTSGYGIVNIVSTDNALISIDSSTAYDQGLRLKYQGSDKWYVGIRGSDAFSFGNSADTRVVTITQGEDVGIGTTAPNAALEINRATNAVQLQITGNGNAAQTTGIGIHTGATRRGFIGWRGTSSSGFAAAGMYLINYDNSPLVFGTTATEAGRFSLDGNFSVGTTTQYLGTNVRSIAIGAPAYPALAFYANDVYKATIIVAGVNWTFGTVAGNHITFEPGGSEKVVFKASGEVGIGTASPYGRLSVSGAHASGRGIVDIRSTDTAFVSIDSAINDTGLRLKAGAADKWLIGTRSTDSLYFNNASDVTQVSFTQGGNVGINVASPGGQLQVSREDGGRQMLLVRNYSTAATGAFTGNYAAEIRTAYTTGATGGALLVHTQEADSSRPTMAVSDANGIFATFVAGRVGIGTASPTYKLHVEGNVYANGSVLARGLRSGGRGELFLNSATADNVAEIFFGYGNGYTEGNIRWGISDRGSGDPNLRIYKGPYHGGFADIVSFNASTNASIFYGNVGIGTTSPNALLVAKASGNYGTIACDNSTTTGGGSFSVRKNGSTIGVLTNKGAWYGDTTNDLVLAAETGYNVRIYTNGSASEKFIFTTDGRFGNNTTTPAANIHVLGPNTASRGQVTVVGDGTDARITLYNGSTFNAAFSAGNSDSYIGTESNTPFRFITNGSEKVRIAAGGDVAIGRNSTNNNRLFVSGTHTSGRALVGLQATDNGANLLGFFSSADARYAYIAAVSGSTFDITNEQNTAMLFYTNSAERVRITAAGDTFVGTTTSWSSARFVSERNSTSVPAAEFNGTGQTAGLAPVYIWNNAESGSTYFISFYSDGVNNPRTLRGYINYRRDIATINLTTASDYRIKTIHGSYTKSGEVFDKIQVHDGTMHGASMGHVPMVVAHELEEAVPYAVEGEKDAVNEDGTPKLQMVSYTAMIPLMLAEIKSLRARVAELEAR